MESDSRLRRGNSKERRDDIEGLLVKSASELFCKRGYHETSLQDVAESLGMTKGGLYYYVDSKEKLLYEIHHRFITEGLSRLRDVEKTYSDPITRLERLIDAHVGIMHEFRYDIQVFFEGIRYLNGDNREQMKLERDNYTQVFLNAIQEGIDQGTFKDVSAKLAAFHLLGSLNWMYTWYQPERGEPSNIASIFSRLTIDGLRRGEMSG